MNAFQPTEMSLVTYVIWWSTQNDQKQAWIRRENRAVFSSKKQNFSFILNNFFAKIVKNSYLSINFSEIRSMNTYFLLQFSAI